MFCLIFIIFFFIMVFMMMNFVLSDFFYKFYKENLLFECGFESLYWTHSKISSHFFKIGLIFVLFDLEIMFLLLMINMSKLFIEIWLIILFLLMTLLAEIYLNSLAWSF